MYVLDGAVEALVTKERLVDRLGRKESLHNRRKPATNRARPRRKAMNMLEPHAIGRGTMMARSRSRLSMGVKDMYPR